MAPEPDQDVWRPSRAMNSSACIRLRAIFARWCSAHGKDVKIVGLNDASVLMRERLGGKLGAGH